MPGILSGYVVGYLLERFAGGRFDGDVYENDYAADQGDRTRDRDDDSRNLR